CASRWRSIRRPWVLAGRHIRRLRRSRPCPRNRRAPARAGAPGPHARPPIRPPGRTESMQVFVRDNDVDHALRQLKRKLRREGLFRELKRRRAYEKPSERRARERVESVRRRRKALRKRLEREGY